MAVMTANKAIKMLLEHYEGRFSGELGVNLSSGNSAEIFKWFLASVLFGARISGNIVRKTFREFVARNVISPKTILDTGWDGLVKILDCGGYIRYDFKTATKLLDLCRALSDNYHADLARLNATATDPEDLEHRLASLARGIGDVTVNIFLREMRGIWEKADPLPADLAILAAKDRGIVPRTMRNQRMILEHLRQAWKKAGGNGKNFPEFEAALVRAGIEARRKSRSAA